MPHLCIEEGGVTPWIKTTGLQQQHNSPPLALQPLRVPTEAQNRKKGSPSHFLPFQASWPTLEEPYSSTDPPSSAQPIGPLHNCHSSVR